MEKTENLKTSEEKYNIINQLIHACADEVCGYPSPSYEQFKNSMEWSKVEYDSAYYLISSVLQNPVCLYLDEEKMPVDYHALTEEIQKRIFTCIKVRRKDLTEALLKQHSKTIRPTFRDFDWRLKLVMGSSKIASLREPLLQLDLMVEEKENERLLGIELNKDELDMVINALESAIQ